MHSVLTLDANQPTSEIFHLVQHLFNYSARLCIQCQWNTVLFGNVVNQISHPFSTKPTRCLYHLTTPVGPAAFPICNHLIANTTSFSEMRQQGPITPGQSAPQSQLFSTFKSLSIYFLHRAFIPSASDTTFPTSFFPYSTH